MTALLVLLPFVPAIVAGLIAATGWRPVTGWLASGSCLAVVGIGVAAAVRVLGSGPITAMGGQLRVDSLSALMIIFIGAIGALSTAYSVGYLSTELDNGSTTPRRALLYGVLMQVTIAAMLVVVIADNMGVVWVAVETTTIATVLLVGHRRDRASVEASWKYLVLGSVGVATALLGHGAGVLRLASDRHRRVDGAQLEHTRRKRPEARPGCVTRCDRVRRRRLWHQGRTRTAPLLASRRVQPGTGASRGADGGGALVDVDVRAAALQGHRRHRPR